MDMQVDYVVVGGGSAGCVLAARLSESGRHRVVLIEAGRDQPPDRVDADIQDSYPRVAYFDPRNTWSELRVRMGPLSGNGVEQPPLKRYEQARIMGGGSSINDMQANRGLPSDYRSWAEDGALGWDWDDVLPYFRKLERDLDYEGELHGLAGPIPVRRIQPSVWPRFSQAAADAMGAMGYPALADQNAEFGEGYFPVAISNIHDRRVSAASAYLDNKTRRRENLRILSDTQVERLLTEGTRIVGLVARGRDGTVVIHCGEVILSSGALQSPLLLLRSGIGPGDDLAKLGMQVLADRRGVGRNLQEHPALSISAFMARDARLQDSLRRHIHLGLRYSSGHQSCPAGDMYMVALSKTGWHPVGRQIGSLVTWVNRPFSRGRIKLTSPDPHAAPDIAFNMLSDARDTRRLMDGLRLAARLFEQAPLRAAASDPFPTSYSERIRDLGIVSAKNLVLTGVLAKLLDGPAWVRKSLLRWVVTEGAPLEKMLRDEDVFETFVRNEVHGVWHASCSCRMGREDDPDAVVTPHGKVIGVDGLRVVDASVMPSVPSANTNIPTIMVAEKMSQHILAERVPSGPVDLRGRP